MAYGDHVLNNKSIGSRYMVTRGLLTYEYFKIQETTCMKLCRVQSAI